MKRRTVLVGILSLMIVVVAAAKTPRDLRFTPRDAKAGDAWHVHANLVEDQVRFVITIRLPKDKEEDARPVGYLTIVTGKVVVCSCDIHGEVRNDYHHIQFIFNVHKDYLVDSKFHYLPSFERGTQTGYIVLGDFVNQQDTPKVPEDIGTNAPNLQH